MEPASTTTATPEMVTETDETTEDMTTPAPPSGPRRTVFRRTVEFNLDDSFGPDVRAVASVRLKDDLATHFVKIEKQTLIPGEKVGLHLHVPAVKKDSSARDDIENVCLLRMADTSNMTAHLLQCCVCLPQPGR